MQTLVLPSGFLTITTEEAYAAEDSSTVNLLVQGSLVT